MPTLNDVWTYMTQTDFLAGFMLGIGLTVIVVAFLLPRRLGYWLVDLKVKYTLLVAIFLILLVWLGWNGVVWLSIVLKPAGEYFRPFLEEVGRIMQETEVSGFVFPVILLFVLIAAILLVSLILRLIKNFRSGKHKSRKPATKWSI